MLDDFTRRFRSSRSCAIEEGVKNFETAKERRALSSLYARETAKQSVRGSRRTIEAARPRRSS